MNEREARLVNDLLTYVLTPHADVVGDYNAAEEAVTALAARAHDVLGSGWTGPDASMQWEQTWWAGCAGCPVCRPQVQP